MWVEFERYHWNAFMTSQDLMGAKNFNISNYYGMDLVDTTFLATDGYVVYIKCKTYTCKGSTRIIFKKGKSEIIVKINKAFENVEKIFDYLHDKMLTYSKPEYYTRLENKIIIQESYISLDEIFERYTMTELLEYYNKQKYEEIGSKVKKTPVVKLIPKEKIIEEFKEAV